MHYNSARIHKTLRVTPAMAAGIANHVWSIEDICGGQLTPLRKTLLILVAVVGTVLVLVIGLLFYFRLTSERVSN